MTHNSRTRVPPLPRHFEPPKKSKPAGNSGVQLTGWQETVLFILVALVGMFLLIALYSNFTSLPPGENVDPRTFTRMPKTDNAMGQVGHIAASKLRLYLGWCSFVVALCPFFVAFKLWKKGFPQSRKTLSTLFTTIVAAVMVAAVATLATVMWGERAGGHMGATFVNGLSKYVNHGGTSLISSVILLLSFGYCTGIRISQFVSLVTGVFRLMKQSVVNSWVDFKQDNEFLRDKDLNPFKLCWQSVKFVFYAAYTILCAIIYPKPLIDKIRSRFFARTHSHRGGGSGLGSIGNFRVVRIGKRLRLRADGWRKAQRHGYIANTYDNDNDEENSTKHGKTSITKRLRIARQTKPSKKSKAAQTTKDAAGTTRKKSGSQVTEKTYTLPPMSLLVNSESEPSVMPTDEEMYENSRLLETAFDNFKIGGKVTEVHPGPVVTLYQFQPAAGIKVQKVIALANDIAMALKVASVRVYAPVPGKGTVGIEVPNVNREIVRLREIIDSSAWTEAHDSELKMALAKTTFGDPYVADLVRMPHLLIAGATGTGKSVAINSILLSLLYQHTPETLKLILFDPKLLELSAYDGIAHLYTPVVTDPKRAKGVLWWVMEEMERRYALMKELGVRNLSSFNKTVRGEKVDLDALEDEPVMDDEVIELGNRNKLDLNDKIANKEKKKYEVLPWIVIVIDEFADLVMSVREIEELIIRIAQKSRAAGIHLIIATQRPSVNVITGLIKANFPSRISFQVASRNDARTVMDTSGAEKLLGRGDMLFLPPGTGKVKRMHGPFVTDKEVMTVVRWLKSRQKPVYNTQIEEAVKKISDMDEISGAGNGVGGNGELDSEGRPYENLYDKVVAYTMAKGAISTSRIQAEFNIGYPKATRLINQMERDGVIGPAVGSKPRKVIIGGGYAVDDDDGMGDDDSVL